MSSRTIEGLEHSAIDKISAAVIWCEMSRPDKVRAALMEAIGIVCEMRIIHDQLIADIAGPSQEKEDA